MNEAAAGWAETGLPVVVTGLGRCGSSMMMQMMVQGGLKLTGEAEWPMCEDPRAISLPKESQWLKEIGPGEVVKILNPDHYRIPKWFQCCAVWLDRNREEQVKSWVKYGESIRRQDASVKELTPKQIRSIVKFRTGRGVKAVKAVAHGRFVRTSFEDVLANPMAVAEKIQQVFGIELDVTKMAQAVIPRSAKCMKGFMEPGNYKPGAVRMVT